MSLLIKLHDNLIINFRCSLLSPPSQFRQSNTSSCKKFTWGTGRHSPSPTGLYQSKLQPAQNLPYISVPDTRTDFSFCCSFNWKLNSNGKIVLCIITSALDTGELLGWRVCRFICSERQYVATSSLCKPQSQSWRFEREIKQPSLPESETWYRTARILVGWTVFFKKFQVEKVSNLLTNVCCFDSCSFFAPVSSRKYPTDKHSCKYIEKKVADKRQGVSNSLEFAWSADNSSP